MTSPVMAMGGSWSGVGPHLSEGVGVRSVMIFINAPCARRYIG